MNRSPQQPDPAGPQPGPNTHSSTQPQPGDAIADRTVPPQELPSTAIAPELPPPAPPTGICYNCHHIKPDSDRYCRNCGQKHTDLNETVFHFVGEFLVQMLSLDGRVFGTLRQLLFHPGQLTVEFMQGRRRRYLSPVQTYLLSTFLLFFALGNWIQADVENWLDVNVDDPTIANIVAAEKKTQRKIAEQQSAEPTTPTANSTAGPQPETIADDTERNAKASNANADDTEERSTESTEAASDEADPEENDSAIKDDLIVFDDQDFAAIADMDRDQANDYLKKHGFGDHSVLGQLLWNASKLTTEVGAQRYYATLLAIASQVALIMLPLLALLLRLLFWRSSSTLLQSFVLSSNLHVMTNLIVAPLMLLQAPLVAVIAAPLFIAGSHSLLAVRNVYRESWLRCIIKLSIISLIYWFVMFLGLAVISTISLFLYQ